MLQTAEQKPPKDVAYVVWLLSFASIESWVNPTQLPNISLTHNLLYFMLGT
jgi:hypothetical protein